MANYQELLSKAVGALPESNGASRREVYEKARKALVAQLRAISPPLPAREITQHRLELEDCIRQVEHEVTESLLGDLKNVEETSIPLEEPAAEPVAVETVAEQIAGQPQVQPPHQTTNGTGKEPEVETSKPDESIKTKTIPEPVADEVGDNELSIALRQAGSDAGDTGDIKNTEEKTPGTSNDSIKIAHKNETINKSAGNSALDAIIDRAEQAKISNSGSALQQGTEVSGDVAALENRNRSNIHNPAAARPVNSRSDKGIGAAMSNVREVENSPQPGAPAVAKIDAPDPSVFQSSTITDNDAQLVVDRAIQTLDREARGEATDEIDATDNDVGDSFAPNQNGFASGDDEERGGNGLTIFLVLVILLLGAVGGGGYYAWREGYIDLDALFSSEEVATAEQGAPTGNGGQQPDAGNASPVRIIPNGEENPSVGNTATQVNPADANGANVTLEGSTKVEDRLTTDQQTAAANDQATQPENGAVKVEDRLGQSTEAADTALAQGGEANLATTGSAQSLLLEASTDGASGAVPFSGTVQWSRGVDELGEPTIIGQANIPARNLGVRILIRRNGDRSLPASHLMEIDFDVSSAFAGGSVAGLPGILLKNEELVQGAALVGASARVVGNSFLFALSAADADVRTNLDLLQNRKWMDLAMIYSSGRRAIITLEKDDAAQSLFNDVMGIWAIADAAEAADNG